MTDAVAGGAFEHDRILEFPLLWRSFENNCVDAIADLHYLPAKLSHRRSKQQLFILS